MTAHAFDVIALASATWRHPGPAVATARAGGIGILDLGFCDDAGMAQASFNKLLAGTSGRVGLRVTAITRNMAATLVHSAGDRRLVVLLDSVCAADTTTVERFQSAQRALWAEVDSSDGLDEALGDCFEALVARGHECGGWVGTDTSYILLQKLLAASDRPVYIQGGIGTYTAAAARVAGAAGVVLGDQLLLMPESPLPEALKNELGRLNGSETRLIGELLSSPCRVHAGPSNAQLAEADVLTRQVEADELDIADWRVRMQAMTGWHSPDALRPIGQDIGLASGLARRFASTGRLVQALDALTAKAIASAGETRHLAPDAPLAEAHGTQYPLAQGPMTRVSDSADFARAVSANGALPFLALALMRGQQVDQLLAETSEKMGDLPWGVGLLGFVPQQLREEQIAAIWKYKPPFALIAGGRPDQAAEFENRGIPTYIHAPAPALLRMYLEQGARRFVFEGRECGGHIGPIASFPLWEQMIDVLLTDVAEKDAADIHVLFAGGVHDSLSGAMLAALTAPLAARGMKVGALMGSAYLFTDEIVATGATVAAYRDQALACERTVSLETGPGHSTRCSATPFAQDFYARRRELLREGADHESIRDELESLNLGRLRMASKGRMRDAEGTLTEYDVDAQIRDGMYMIGQVATLNRQVFTLRDLHERVTNGAQDLLSRWSQPEVEPVVEAAPCDVAVVGIGTVLPGAGSAEAYWDNVLQGRSVITEIPRHRFDWELYYDPDPSARDKIYSKWGGFIPETVFDPFKFGIPPMSMKYIDPMQLLSLEVCSRALADAGCADGNFDREHTSVILGAGGGLGDIGMQYGVRSELTRFVEDPDDGVWDRLPEWGQESFSGSLLNVAAGRVANRLDLGGVNFTVDAACGSSLAAITLATQELESGRSNVVLAGGIDTVNSPFGYMCFSKTNALSPTGTPRTFDRSANGIVISEGAAVVVLKRLVDAERDGDRIYSVIKAAAGSSDGRALGMTAPRPEGQMRALNRAYAKAGFSPGDIDMLEAHGTGTAVGDRAEAETITRVLREAGVNERRVALGSVKSILGHTKCAAGVSGLVKTALSLYYRTLPMHVGVDDPIEPISVDDSPVYVPRDPKPWLTRAGRPRRAAVSAFGFGGTNFHVVLEEYRDEFTGEEVPGAKHWPSELCLVRAADRDALVGEIDRLSAALADEPDVSLGELAYGLATEAAGKSGSPVALAIVSSDLATFANDLAAARAHIVDGKPLMPHIQFSENVPATAPKTAFLFPGQGSQYVDMGREPGVYLDDIRGAMELADRVLAADIEPALSRIVWPESLYDDEGENAQKQRLTDTRHAQPALGALEIGYLRLARRLGLSAQASAGHSYGEYGALLAAGVIDESTLLELSAVRGRAMAEAGAAGTPGGMAAVRAARAQVSEHLEAFASIKVANHNAPEETVISGPKSDIEAAVRQLAEAGINATSLPVSGAFHTELVGAAQEPLSRAIAAATFHAPKHAVYSNTLGAAYPAAPEDIRQLLDRHMLSTVEFVEQIRAMHADGVRLFVELGPKSVVSRMASATLAEHEDVDYVALDQRKGTLAGLLSGLGALALAGADFQLTELFAARCITACDRRLLANKRRETPPKTAWMLSGGCARPIDDPVLRTGKERALDNAEKTQAREKARAARQAPAQAAPQPPQPGPATPIQPTAVAQPAPGAPAAPMRPPPGQPGMAQGSGVPPAGSDQAMAAYHDTMRQFLVLQERVMSQFLGQGSAAGPQPQAGTYQPQAPVSQAPVATAPQAASAAPAQPQPSAEPAVQPQAQSAPAPEQLDYRGLLSATVAELTGYPEDMIDADADLEADLGIDSIKRVEILGAFRKQLPQATSEAMQANMEAFTGAKSMSAVLAELEQLPGGTPAPAAKSEASPAAVTPAAPGVDHRALLLSTVAELTGYPEDMIDADADLEADLGIDSIKRVEILGAFRKQLSQATSEAMQANMEAFTGARSVSAITDQLEAMGQDGQAAAPQTPVATSHETTVAAPVATVIAEPSADPKDMPRFVIRSKPKPLSGEQVNPEGLVVIAGPAGETRDALIKHLEQAGAQTATVDATDAQAIEAAITEARQAHGPVRGLVHLYGLTPSKAEQLADWQTDGQRCVLSLFHAIKALGDEIATARVIAASRLGGSLSRETESSGSPLAGGAAGLLKCVAHEYPEATARLVDFNGQSETSIADRLFDEYTHRDAITECGYTGDARHGAVTVAEPLTDNAFSPRIVPEAGWVVLATGGARGITADILAGWVVSDMTLVLAGRSPEPAAEDSTLAEAGDEAAIKRVLLEQSREAGEKIKPVELEARARRVLGAREIRDNLAVLRQAGASVEYHAVDVRDEASFGGLIDDLYARHGRIDAVIHGAGVIEDKLLADKSVESFERVFSTKVDSAWILANHLQADSLKALCFFTSVAGRYGNPGQGDYAAANEAVARLAWQLSRRFTEARVLAINWGPWDAGMVTEGIKRQFRERGLEAIPVAQGVGYFGRELALGARGDVELVAGQGPWAFEQAQEQASDDYNGLPLVRAQLRMGAGGALVLDHRLDIKTDPYLLDHVMDDTPVLPATGALEWMAEAVAAGWPDWQVAEVRGLRVLSGVRLDSNEGVEIEVSARASSHSGLDDQMVDVDIKQQGRKASCYRASVRLVSRLEEPPLFEGAAPLAGEAVTLERAYSHYLFHGPRFQLLDAITVTQEDGVDARVTPSKLVDWLAEPKSGWLFDPGMLDCGPQMAVVWTRRYYDTTALPSSFGSVKRYGHEPLPASLRAVCRLQEGSDGSTLRYDVSFIDDDNRVRVEMRDVSGTGTTALNRLTSGRGQ